MSEDGSKYTNPTGPGYIGRYETIRNGAEISIGNIPGLDWDPSDTIVAIDATDDPSLQIIPGPHPDTIYTCTLRPRDSTIILYVSPNALETMPGYERGDELRLYRYETIGLTIVPATNDPLVSNGTTT
jgi:hypothetical protein